MRWRHRRRWTISCHNLLEELGRQDEAGRPHPDLLKDLVTGAGLSHRLPRLEAEADEDLRRVVVEPLLYGSLREVGLAALTEIVAFEYMLARVSRCFARALAEHRGVPAHALTWFTHHSEVDIRHAEQGLDDLEAYARYYDFTTDEALTIAGDGAARERVRAPLLSRLRDAGRGAAMKLVAATIYALRIPFVEAFSHSASERRWSDSVVVRVRDDAGTRGSARGPRVPT